MACAKQHNGAAFPGDLSKINEHIIRTYIQRLDHIFRD